MKIVRRFKKKGKCPKLPFFISDIVPKFKDNSVLYLFGKVPLEEEYVNTVVTVKDVMREIYVMP